MFHTIRTFRDVLNKPRRDVSWQRHFVECCACRYRRNSCIAGFKIVRGWGRSRRSEKSWEAATRTWREDVLRRCCCSDIKHIVARSDLDNLKSFDFSVLRCGYEASTLWHFNKVIHAFIRAFMHSFMHSCIHSCIHAFMHAFMHSCMHSCIHAFMHSCIHAFMHSCIHAFMHSCIHAFMHSCIHAFMHSCIHAFMHSCIHAFIHSFQTYG